MGRFIMRFAAAVAAMSLATTASGQTNPDPNTDGMVKGALIGAAAGAAAIVITYNNLADNVDAPAMSGPLWGATGFGAGIGTLVGYLIDRHHRPSAPDAQGAPAKRDSVLNGAMIGAAAGAGFALVDYAVDPSEPGNAQITAAAVGLGALAGAGIDALVHQEGRISITPAVASRTKAVWVGVRF